MNDVFVRPTRPSDAEDLARIYNHYVTNTTVTFDEEPLTALQMQARCDDVAATKLPWLVAVHGDQVVGFAYANRWKSRVGYRYAVETTVYLHPGHGGQGIGTRLYDVLWADLRRLGMHTAIAGICLPNAASVALHEKFGMKQVAQFREVGFKFNQWVDVGYWQCAL